MRSTRELNIILREYIKQIVVESLEGCEDFVKVYGRGFAERKFEENVKDVYSNERNSESAGYYSMINRDITICSAGKRGRLLTPKEVEQNEDLKATCIHEGIHAVLRRIIKLILKKDKKRIKTKKIGTGIQEYKENGTEIGRGINEGLTEWICKKAGLKATAYKNLRKILDQLEIAIGPRKVMKLGKGDIVNRVTKLLGMHKRECEFFLGLGDQEYELGRNSEFFTRVIEGLEGEVNPKDFEEIKQDFRIKNFLRTHAYSLDIAERGQDKEAEIILEYAREQKEDIEFARRGNLLSIDSLIFDKYFKKEFEQMQYSKGIPWEQLEKFARIAALMQEDVGDENEQGYSSIKFQRQFEIIRERYLTETCGRIKTNYREGTLSCSTLMDYFNRAARIDEEAREELLSRLADEIDLEHSLEVAWLISSLYEKGKINEINRYSIKAIKTEHLESVLYLKDDKLLGRVNTGVKGQDSNSFDVYPDLEPTADEQCYNRINNFLKLKEATLKVEPEATMQILRGIIMISGANGTKIYIEDKGQIIPVEDTEEVKFAFASNDKSKKSTTLALRALIDKTKEYIFRKQLEAPGKRLETRIQMNEFKTRIGDMSNYDVVAKERMSEGHITHRKREDNSR